MKLRIPVILLFPLFTFSLTAQAPNGFSYQSILRNANGNTLNNQNINVRISLLEGSATGTSRYTEIHTLNTNANGLINLVIGQGSNPSSDFSAIEWGKHSFYLKVETAPDGDDNYTLSTTSQLMSVPYALHANKTTVLENASAGDLFYHDGRSLKNVPIGSQGQILTVDANMPVWSDKMNYYSNKKGTFTDERDGMVYQWIKIGTQIWMAENLRATTYADGTAIPYITSNTAWVNLAYNNTSKAYCFYYNDESLGYGTLYTFAAAVNSTPHNGTSHIQGICPTGWHVPCETEWAELENYLITNGYNYDGTTNGNKIAKSLASTTGWSSSSTTGTVGNNQTTNNNTGYTALPGGYRDYDNGAFYHIGSQGNWWCSTELDTRNAFSWGISSNSSDLYNSTNFKTLGISVRCIKD